ncbi:MAG TPA: acyl-CoA dehydrogenase family protein [Blastocatellia bacterium]|nr:acyl-CoA dehydrogenase family protein [Blastocatellia bacterium]
MDFDLNETQKLFKSSARELFAQECPPEAVRAMIENGVPYSDKLWGHLAEQGWTGLIFDEADGGMGLGYVEMAVAFEEMGRALVPGAFLSTVALAGALIARAGNAAQRQRYLQAICEGKARATVALLEASGDWDVDATQLQAAETATGLTLNGTKRFVADAGAVDFIITAARAGSELVLAIVESGATGLSVKPMPAVDATRHLYEVTYDNVEVAAADVLARGEAARAALEHALDVATVALAAEMVGGMQWALDTTVEYAKTRKQFGKPIGQFQAIQHHCANILLLTESARSAVYYAAWQLGNATEQAPLAVSVAKAYTSDAYREVGNLGIQVHGGIGFTWDEPLHFYYKRAKASELMFGDATFHRERIARLVIDTAAPAKAARTSGD